LPHANRGQKPEVGRAEASACHHCRQAGSEVFTAQAPILASGLTGRNQDGRAVLARDFLDDHGVAAIGHDRAGHDAHGVASLHWACVGLPSERSARLHQSRFSGGMEVAGAYGPTVHCRVVVRRHIDR
jgi:hypothetical protein